MWGCGYLQPYRDGWIANIVTPILDQQSLDLRSPTGAYKMAEILLNHFSPKPAGETISILLPRATAAPSPGRRRETSGFGEPRRRLPF